MSIKKVLIILLIITGVMFSACDLSDSDDSDYDDYSSSSSSSTDDSVQVGDFSTTSSTYSWDDDIEAEISSDYGSGYRIADWTDLEDLGTDIDDLISRLGISEGTSLFVTYNGNNYYTTTRRYYMSYHNHDKPDNYLAHDNIDNYYVSLGSWDSTLRVLLIETSTSTSSSTSTGTVSGYVIDSTTGYGVSGVSIYDVSSSSYSTTSGTSGYYSFSVPSGTRTIRFYKSGYTFSDVSVSVTSGETTTISSNNTVGNPELDSGELRFVLTWGSSPTDLDSYLSTPLGDLVYYGDKYATGANLDVDDTSSYGPETITITSQSSGTYEYYVHQYSSTGSLATSSATVRIYDSTGLLRTVYVPTYGTGDYWHVLNVSGTSITVYNDIQSSAP